MNKYRLDFYRKKDNNGVSMRDPIYLRSQFIDAKNIKEVTFAVSLIGNYNSAPPESTHNYENEDYLVTVLKFDKKKQLFT
jgi:hypothetical protein